MNLKQKALKLPQKPGVYLFKRKKIVLYVGKAINLSSRVSSYFASNVLPKTKKMISLADSLDFILVESEIEALLLEANLIQKHQPRYNFQAKDDKSPIYIKITRERLPKVFLGRKKNLKEKDICFGPFQSSYTTRKVLKIARKIFPFCTCKEESGKPCLYVHLGLCDPSPREIVKLLDQEKQEKTVVYRKNIANLKAFLSGKSQKIIKDLKNEMKGLSEQEKFEEARSLRDQITLLEFFLLPKQKISDYLENPNLYEDLREQEIKSLSDFLLKISLIEKPLSKTCRIEGYDISRSSNEIVVGSMVVFKNGQASKKDYRKFKIRINRSLDDAKQLSQVIRRRLAHNEWETPDLILLDGGKPQLSLATKTIYELNCDIPIIALAKKQETIYWLRNGFHQKRFKKTNPALKLLQRTRDESHRFAHNYQDKLKRKIT